MLVTLLAVSRSGMSTYFSFTAYMLLAIIGSADLFSAAAGIKKNQTTALKLSS